jgi:hypothetical protein
MCKRCSKCNRCPKEDPKKDPDKGPKKKCCVCKTVCLMFFSLLCGCMIGVHKNVIKACIKGEPLPAAPKWHIWCR